MWPFKGKTPSSAEEYMHLRQSSDEEASELDLELSQKPRFLEPSSSHRWYRNIFVIILSTITLLGIGFSSGVFLEKTGTLAKLSTSTGHDDTSQESKCHDPAIRREWRSLSLEQKHGYVDAVLCLRKTPSKLNENMTRYDDFPFLHTTVGEYGKYLVPNSCYI